MRESVGPQGSGALAAEGWRAGWAEVGPRGSREEWAGFWLGFGPSGFWVLFWVFPFYF